MIYTCYEMIRDCRAGKPEGWAYFTGQYEPVAREIAARYRLPASGGLLDRLGPKLFETLEPMAERPFIVALRQAILAQMPGEPSPPPVDLEALTAGLGPLTMLQRQAVWLETMGYDPAASGRMLRMAPQTVEQVRERAAELLREKLDTWSRTLLSGSGLALGRMASDAATDQCLPAKLFLDMIDGRTTWRGREEIERHATGCWHCIDHHCRLLEVVDLLRGMKAR